MLLSSNLTNNKKDIITQTNVNNLHNILNKKRETEQIPKKKK